MSTWSEECPTWGMAMHLANAMASAYRDLGRRFGVHQVPAWPNGHAWCVHEIR